MSTRPHKKFIPADPIIHATSALILPVFSWCAVFGGDGRLVTIGLFGRRRPTTLRHTSISSMQSPSFPRLVGSHSSSAVPWEPASSFFCRPMGLPLSTSMCSSWLDQWEGSQPAHAKNPAPCTCTECQTRSWYFNFNPHKKRVAVFKRKL